MKPHHSPKRQPRPIHARPVASSGEVADVGAEERIYKEPSYQELFDLIDLGPDGELNDSRQNILGVVTLRTIGQIKAVPEAISPDVFPKTVALTVAGTLLDSIELLRTHGIDFLDESSQFNAESPREKITRALQLIRFQQDKLTSRSYDTGVTQAAMNIFEVLIANSKAVPTLLSQFENGKSSFVDELKNIGLSEEEALRYINLKEMYYKRLGYRAPELRRDLIKRLKRLNTPEFIAFFDEEADKVFSAEDISLAGDSDGKLEKFEVFGGQKLDFQILPAGTNVREYAQEIFENLTPSEKALVDMRRVKLLVDLKEQFGEGRTYFIHGKPKGNIVDRQGEAINEAYLGVVMQHHDQNGNVIGEDCVVISPVTRRNSAFVVRHDVSQLAWREVLKVPKISSRALGARKVMFTSPDGTDLYETIFKKINLLFQCPPQEFSQNNEFRYNPEVGSYSLRARKSLGGSAVLGASLSYDQA